MGSNTDGWTSPTQEESYVFNSYGINQIPVNSSFVVTAEQPMSEFVAIPKAQCVSMQSIGWVYNVSIPGLRSVMLDAVDYGRDSMGDVCGTFLLFKFSFDSIDEKTVPALDSALVNRLGDYTLKRSYIGLLPVNLSGAGTDRIYVIGSADIAKGDMAEILLFQKTSDGTVFALERSRIANGPVVPAKVLALTGYIAQGTVRGDYDPGKIEGKINVTNSRFTPVMLAVNGSLDNSTAERLNMLAGVSVENNGNQTLISCNSSMDEAEAVLKENNITYAKQDGSVVLQTPLSTSVSDIREALKAGGVTDPEIKKAGVLEVPQAVRINGKIVSVDNSDSFDAVLDIDAVEGSRVNLTLSTIEFGDQVFILGGSQAE